MKPYLLLFAATLLLAAEIPCDYTCTHLSISVPIQKYVDSLPMPTVLSPSRRRSHNNEYDYYEITMRRGSAKMHRDLPEVPIFGYGGSYPGPSIEAHKGRPVVVKWVNEMYPPHIIETDDVMDFSMAAEILHIPKREITPTRAVVHLHGGRTANDSDGLPLAFYGPHGEANGGRNHRVYRYENQQRSALLFYHDHAIGITRTNVYAGLAGLYIIRDDEESNANLPEGQFEIPLLIQDKVFKYQPSTKGRKRSLNLFYPRVWVPEFFGDVIVVNGKIWPYLEVQPRKYRLRIVNGSDSRFYHLSFIYEDSSVTMPLSEDIKIPFELIGLEQGLLDSPVTVTSVLIAPAERMDIIVDFTNHHSRNILLFNDAPVPFTVENFPLTQEQIDEATSNGAFPDLCGTAQIMQFKVKRCTSAEVVPVPITLPDLPPLDVTDAHERTLFLNEVVDANDNPVKLLLNNKEFLGDPLVTDFVQYGTTELWHLINFTPDNHPIHPHLVEFKVLYRRPFTPGPGEFEVTNIGAQVAPDETEGGYKDTVKVPPGMITTIAARFNKCGRYVWHCHILSHEENDMMNFYEVINCP